MALNVLNQKAGDGWSLFNADCVEFLAGMPANSVDLSVYSPPFSSLYIYSESERDMGNVASHSEFFDSYRHVVRELLRITRPGRETAIHIKDLVYYSNSSEKGDRGLYDFSAGCSNVHTEEGWTLHRKITVRRDPVKEMQKTKADRLLYKHFKADAARTGGGMPEYIYVFRKWADGMDDTARVVHPASQYPLEVWQAWAQDTWEGLPETDVLNVGGKTDEEKHLCPMPLNLIRRIVLQYTNEGEVVLSPFAGIGSEGYESVRHNRRFIGTELSDKYFAQAVKNLQRAEKNKATGDLFEGAAA